MTQATQPIIIVLAQLNLTVGDITGNTNKMIAAAQQARDELHADMIVFPELALSGYPPEDLVLRHDFTQAVQHALHKLAHGCFKYYDGCGLSRTHTHGRF